MSPFQGLNRRIKPYFTALLQTAWQLNQRAYLSSGKRSTKTQARLYAEYMSGRSRYPAAVPGSSKHERGLAVDIGGLSSSELEVLGSIWESWGGRWGGNFRTKDAIHFEV